MVLVTTVNNVSVYSDKRVQNIIDSRVEFTDGSWCDAATGRIVNCGPGEISMSGTSGSTSSDAITMGPRLYQASRLVLDRVMADVTVETHEGLGMQVSLIGPQAKVEAIRAEVRNDVLVITGGSPGRSGMTVNSVGGSMHVRGRRNIVASGDLFVNNTFDGGVVVVNDDGMARVHVKVPLGTPIVAFSGNGDICIGDVNGLLTACVFGSGDIKAGSMASVDLQTRGSGNIHVTEVNGSALVANHASGDIAIKAGTISTLTVTVMSLGHVKIGGAAQRAALSIQGSGNIRVARVLGQLTRKVEGSGKISVPQFG